MPIFNMLIRVATPAPIATIRPASSRGNAPGAAGSTKLDRIENFRVEVRSGEDAGLAPSGGGILSLSFHFHATTDRPVHRVICRARPSRTPTTPGQPAPRHAAPEPGAFREHPGYLRPPWATPRHHRRRARPLACSGRGRVHARSYSRTGGQVPPRAGGGRQRAHHRSRYRPPLPGRDWRGPRPGGGPVVGPPHLLRLHRGRQGRPALPEVRLAGGRR